MQVSSLVEFVTFAKYLNYTHAATELHMTQSGLSKHVKQLETELGFNLVARNGNSLALTAAGSKFLTLIQPILDNLEDAIDKCRQLNQEEPFDFIAQMPLYPDEGATAYYTLVQQIHDIAPTARIRFKDTARISLRNSLRNDLLHLAMAYHCDDVDQRIKRYNELGFSCKYLVTEPLAIWVDESSELNRDAVSVSDLNNHTILVPNEKCFLMGDAIRQLCNQRHINAHFEIVDSNSFAEFVASHHPAGIYIYPKSLFENSPIIKATPGRVIVPFTNDSVQVHVFAVAYPTNSNGSIVAQQLLTEPLQLE